MALAKAYAVSKYMLLLFTVELAERVQNRGVAVNAVHPGIVKTSERGERKYPACTTVKKYAPRCGSTAVHY